MLRTRTLLQLSDGFVVLPGRAGTLAEVAIVWALHRAGLLGPRPLVLVGPVWTPLMDQLHRLEFLEPGQDQVTRIVGSAEEAADLVVLGLDSYDRFRSGEPAA